MYKMLTKDVVPMIFNQNKKQLIVNSTKVNPLKGRGYILPSRSNLLV